MLHDEESLAHWDSCDDVPRLALVGTAPYVLADLVVVDGNLRVARGESVDAFGERVMARHLESIALREPGELWCWGPERRVGAVCAVQLAPLQRSSAPSGCSSWAEVDA